MTARVAGSVAAGTLRPQPLTLAETPPASHLAGAALVSDIELITRTRQGDHRSFGTLYLRHLHAAWRIACTSAASAADAEDAVAEGFAKVFAALPRMVDRDLAFRPYLLACVRNAAVDRHHCRRRSAGGSHRGHPRAQQER
jgi:DNA-directed RNA polymerase specialized sigma24 family protein